ncbi:hypothetical protein WJX81_001299 [Elliptochloris bilobata]|uniref:Coiled-coil domain-containing protein 12 n=1 Tax=Elliptochloris bilobata TaxID=381761 RepID=A0AAW1SKP3_9CHLO
MDKAAARRDRLRAMRTAAAEAGEDSPPPAAKPAAPEEPQLRFRNYNVHDKKNIAHSTVEAAQPPKFEEPRVDPEMLPSLDADADLLVNVAPKKPNWDLRRDVAKKLEKLERRTQRAIVQLLQQEQRAVMEQDVGQAD